MEYLQKVSEVQYGRLHRVPKGTMLADSWTVGVVIVVVH